MKVLISSDSGAVNGANTVLRTLLAGLAKRGWETRLFLDDVESNVIFSEVYPSPSHWDQVMEEWQPDLAVAMHGKVLRFAKQAKKHQLPVLWLCHQSSWLGCPGAVGVEKARALPELAPLFFDRVIVPSDHLKSQLGMPDRTVTIKNGVDVSQFFSSAQWQGTEFRARHHIGEGESVTGYAARWVPYKAHLEVFELFCRANLPGHLVLAGSPVDDRSGTCVSLLAQAIEERGMKERVIVTHLSYDQMPGFYGALDLFLSTSRFESFGVVKMEAMAAGVPVVALGVSGAKEVLQGYWGLGKDLSDVEEKSRRLLFDSGFRQEMGKMSRDFVEAHYGAEGMVESYDREFCALIN